MKQYVLFFLILLLISICLYLLNCNCSKNLENFELGSNYNINYNASKKIVQIFNISSKVVGDKTGSGLSFNGQNSFLKIPKSELNRYTLSFIINFNNTDKRQSIINNGWELYIENSYLYIVFENEKLLLEKRIEPKEYVHMAVLVENNKNNITLFLDGIQISKEFNKKFTNRDIIMGRSKTGGSFFKGIISEISLYSTIISNTELCNMFNSCGLKDCKFVPNGNTPDECYSNCLNSKEENCDETNCANKCLNPNTRSWKKPCNFIPYGSDIFSCIDKCASEKTCNYKECQRMCQECKNLDNCPWNIVENVEEPNPFQPELLDDNLDGQPIPPKIKVKPYNGKLLIEWNQPKQRSYKKQLYIKKNNINSDVSTTTNNPTNNTNTTKQPIINENSVENNIVVETEEPIKAYVCILYKTLNKQEGIRLSMVPYPKCKKCSFVVDNLNEDEFYSVGIRAYNNKGLSKLSNIISVQPKYKIKIKAPEPTESNDTKETIHYCNPKN